MGPSQLRLKMEKGGQYSLGKGREKRHVRKSQLFLGLQCFQNYISNKNFSKGT